MQLRLTLAAASCCLVTAACSRWQAMPTSTVVPLNCDPDSSSQCQPFPTSEPLLSKDQLIKIEQVLARLVGTRWFRSEIGAEKQFRIVIEESDVSYDAHLESTGTDRYDIILGSEFARALLEKPSSDQDAPPDGPIAFVLGHEIAHAKHGRRPCETYYEDELDADRTAASLMAAAAYRYNKAILVQLGRLSDARLERVSAIPPDSDACLDCKTLKEGAEAFATWERWAVATDPGVCPYEKFLRDDADLEAQKRFVLRDQQRQLGERLLQLSKACGCENPRDCEYMQLSTMVSSWKNNKPPKSCDDPKSLNFNPQAALLDDATFQLSLEGGGIASFVKDYQEVSWYTSVLLRYLGWGDTMQWGIRGSYARLHRAFDGRLDPIIGRFGVDVVYAAVVAGKIRDSQRMRWGLRLEGYAGWRFDRGRRELVAHAAGVGGGLTGIVKLVRAVNMGVSFRGELILNSLKTIPSGLLLLVGTVEFNMGRQ